MTEIASTKVLAFLAMLLLCIGIICQNRYQYFRVKIHAKFLEWNHSKLFLEWNDIFGTKVLEQNFWNELFGMNFLDWNEICGVDWNFRNELKQTLTNQTYLTSCCLHTHFSLWNNGLLISKRTKYIVSTNKCWSKSTNVIYNIFQITILNFDNDKLMVKIQKCHVPNILNYNSVFWRKIIDTNISQLHCSKCHKKFNIIIHNCLESNFD